ncbi:MAG: dTDP-4-dehydrorhamnose reductase [Candidatus Aenigmatarchaeota archaeon]
MVEKVEKKKVLITGVKGMLGNSLREKLELDYEVFGIDKDNCDITDKNLIKKFFQNLSIDVVIHCAAYTDVDKAEEEARKVFLVNRDGTKNILEVIEKDTLFIYISTDYVFNGTKKAPYNEEDKPSPLNTYGKSKLEGEKLVSFREKYLIIRTSWLFGPKGDNFVDSILNLAKKRVCLKVVNDQIGSPTYTLDLAEAIKKFLNLYFEEKLVCGIYHITNNGSCSWFEFASYILKIAGLDTKLMPISSLELKKRAKRPKNSVLSNEKFYRLTGGYLRNWQEAVRDYLESYILNCN